MIRYTLRNKHKIENHYNKKILKRIMASLAHDFNDKSINEAKKLYPDDQYKTMLIDDYSHTCGLIAFYIIRKTYNVYLLAFKEFIS